ncbi:GNAT family N-acetyltransferase [Pantoea cypripedii]|uniref:N-acetyltransferase n=1 Tax=Pantoea cypripedii TaxID=55209 RepID=A0A6B9GB50_PANCY|nr:GNAT family N-acetyltransferase [Pantoea cypripedii]QGY30389.1 N-acetyltransferase [Pantoea cypripedii]
MKITDLPSEYLLGKKIKLVAPDVNRSHEMFRLILDFSAAHREFLDWVDNFCSDETVLENMNIASEDFSDDRGEYKFLIINNTSDQLVGCVSLFIRHYEIPYFEIGYWLSTKAMGRGYTTEACILVRDLAYNFLNAKRLEIRMAGRNIRSRRIAERCGFLREAVLRNNRIDGFGNVDDTYIYTYLG